MKLKRIMFGLLALIFCTYGIMAVEHSAHLYFEQAPQIWQRFFESLTPKEYATALGSVSSDQSKLYVSHRGSMLIHTVFGGTALIVGLLQLWPRLRAKARIHRRLGYLYLTATAVSLLGSSLFLLAIESRQAFSGTTFYWGLSGLCLASWEVLVWVFWTAKKRSLALHREYSTLSFSFLATAPILRMAWIAGAPLGTQAQVNLCASMFLIPLCILPCNLLIRNRNWPLIGFDDKSWLRGAALILGMAMAALALFFQTMDSYRAFILSLFVTNFLLLFSFLGRKRQLLRSMLYAHPLLLGLSLVLFANHSPVVLSGLDQAILASFGIPALAFLLWAVFQSLHHLKVGFLSAKWSVFVLATSLSPLFAGLAYPWLLRHYDPSQSLRISLMMSYALSVYLGHRLVMEINFGFLKANSQETSKASPVFGYPPSPPKHP